MNLIYTVPEIFEKYLRTLVIFHSPNVFLILSSDTSLHVVTRLFRHVYFLPHIIRHKLQNKLLMALSENNNIFLACKLMFVKIKKSKKLLYIV